MKWTNSSKGKYNSAPGNGSSGKTRKQLRKEKRNTKRQSRRDYYSRRSNYALKMSSNQENHNQIFTNVQHTSSKHASHHDILVANRNYGKSSLSDSEVTGESTGKRRNRKKNIAIPKRASLEKAKACGDSMKSRKRAEDSEHEKLQEDMRTTRKLKLNEENEEEEKLIKKLEKQLKLSKRKSSTIPKSFTADGLDYLLDVCDGEKVKQMAAVENGPQDTDSEFEDDLATTFSRKKEVEQKDNMVQEENLAVASCSGLSSSAGSSCVSDRFCATQVKACTSGAGSDSDSDFIDSELESQSSVSSFNDIGESDGCKYRDDDYYGSDEASFVEGAGNNSVWETNISEAGDETESVVQESTKKPENISAKKLLKGKRVHFRDTEESESEGNSSSTKKLKVRSTHGSKRKTDSPDLTQSFTKKRKLTKKSKQQNNDGNYVSAFPPPMFVGSSEGDASSSDNESPHISRRQPEVWQDIYGRLRDQDGNIIKQAESGAYVPPALRAHHSRDDEKNQQNLQKLNRQIKGYFNRLTERNLASISSEIENLYSNNSRHDMNTTFTTILQEALVTKTLSLERMVMEHIALVACLHSRVGSDVGAFVLQSIVTLFDHHLRESLDIENKALDNVTLIICYLYNFNVAHSGLIFDILRCLANKFGPKEVELLLLVLRTVGFGLRKDNPNEMKTLMVQLQDIAQSSDVDNFESRVKFMLEILLAVKNNNITRIPGCDPGPVEQMRKFLRSLLSKGNISPVLNISLKDLLQADERGKWWVVGSAWAGEGPQPSTSTEPNQSDSSRSTYSSELLELARRMRMNTEDRRNIFCILMTAQDYQEAFYNMLQLGLKGRQARDIVLVTLHCCLQEKKFNKYYAHVIQSICAHNRVYWVTLQFAFWDKIRDLKKLSVIQFGNLVQLMQYFLLQGVFTLMMFKIMDLTSLEKAEVRFLRQVLLGILSSEWEECELVFSSVAKVSSYKMFCTGLRVFLQQYVNNKISTDNAQKAFLKERLEKVDALLSGSQL